jgi:hypothetical protein
MMDLAEPSFYLIVSAPFDGQVLGQIHDANIDTGKKLELLGT